MTRPPSSRRPVLPLLPRIFPPSAARPARLNPALDMLADAIPVVLLHGTLDSPGAWAPLADELRDRNRLVFAPAYGDRGTGPLVDSVLEVEEYLGGLAAELAGYGDGVGGAGGVPDIPAVDLVGHSQGSLIALMLYARQVASGRTPKTRFRRVVSLSGSIGGVHLEGIARTAAWNDGALAKSLFGQALADQLAIAAGAFPFEKLLPTAPEPGHEASVPGHAAPDWINVISHYDKLVIPWSDLAQRYVPNSRQVLLEHELGGRKVPHQRQQTDPEIIRLLSRLLTAGAATSPL